MNSEYLKPAEASEIAGVHMSTLRRWAEEGRVQIMLTKSGQRRYLKSSLLSVEERRQEEEIVSVKRKFCYARVSTHSQKEDLKRQIDIFQQEYPNHTIVKDIGSGLNFKRRNLRMLIDLAVKGELEEVVITHKDRLCRFAYELLEDIFKKYSHAKIIVLNSKETSPEEELTDDIISIITVFSSRLYGLRSNKNKKRIEEFNKNKNLLVE